MRGLRLRDLMPYTYKIAKFISLASDTSVRFQTLAAELRHQSPIVDTNLCIQTLVSGSRLQCLILGICPILGTSIRFKALSSDFGQECLFQVLVSGFRHQFPIQTKESDYQNLCPLLDTNVRFYLPVSDFGQNSLTLDIRELFQIELSDT